MSQGDNCKLLCEKCGNSWFAEDYSNVPCPTCYAALERQLAVVKADLEEQTRLTHRYIDDCDAWRFQLRESEAAQVVTRAALEPFARGYKPASGTTPTGRPRLEGVEWKMDEFRRAYDAFHSSSGSGLLDAVRKGAEAVQLIIQYAEEIERACEPGDAQMCAQHIQNEGRAALEKLERYKA